MDYRIYEPSRVVVSARRDLKISLRHERRQSFYFVEDPLRSRFFRLGTAEYRFFSALDGVNTIADATASISGELGPAALTHEQGLALAKWLVDSGLATTEASLMPERLDQAEVRHTAAARKKWNPWYFQVNCGPPARYLDYLAPLGRVLFCRESFLAWATLLLVALLTTVSRATQIASSETIDLGRSGLVSLFAAWCLLKVLHETAHGLACRRFGGTVGCCGIAFILGMPSPFVETSSVWRMPNKWHRITVSLAGIYVELFVAAIALLIWAHVTGDIVRQTALAVAAIASIGTLIFNLNPLMRFDGYFALSDWVEIPNLAGVARQACSRAARRILLGIDEPVTEAELTLPAWIAWFGLAGALWRTFMAACLVLLALAKFGAFVTALMAVLPITYFVTRIHAAFKRRLAGPPRRVTINRSRLARTYGLFAAAAIIGFQLFDPREIRLPAVVEYEPLCVVRAETPGFLDRLCVTDGGEVVSGQVLLVLKNEELDAQIGAAKQELEQSVTRTRIHRDANEVAKEQSEMTRHKALATKLQELQRRREALIVRAPISGRVVSHGLAKLEGCWIEAGGELLSVGNEREKELLAAVSQFDVELLQDSSEVVAQMSGNWSKVPVRVGQVEPRAIRDVLHPALSVENGGPLPVRHHENASVDSHKRKTIEVELHEPYFRLHGRFEADVAEKLFAGRTATLYMRTSWIGLAKRTQSRVEAWLSAILQ